MTSIHTLGPSNRIKRKQKQFQTSGVNFDTILKKTSNLRSTLTLQLILIYPCL